MNEFVNGRKMADDMISGVYHEELFNFVALIFHFKFWWSKVREVK